MLFLSHPVYTMFLQWPERTKICIFAFWLKKLEFRLFLGYKIHLYYWFLNCRQGYFSGSNMSFHRQIWNCFLSTLNMVVTDINLLCVAKWWHFNPPYFLYLLFYTTFVRRNFSFTIWVPAERVKMWKRVIMFNSLPLSYQLTNNHA